MARWMVMHYGNSLLPAFKKCNPAALKDSKRMVETTFGEETNRPAKLKIRSSNEKNILPSWRWLRLLSRMVKALKGLQVTNITTKLTLRKGGCKNRAVFLKL